MRTTYAYIALLILSLLTACTEQELGSNSSSSSLQPDEFRFTVSIPTPMETSTRAIGDELTQDYVTSLPMHVLVFDENGFFFAFQEAKAETFTPDENGGGKGTYTVSLPNSNTRCFLHFVLGNVNWEQYTASDSETSIFSQLETSNDVYWQRVEVENILKDENGQVTSLLETIKLVRNYAQISLDVSAEVDNFKLVDYTIIHESTVGTVAPYCGNETETTNGAFASFDLAPIPSGSDYYTVFTERNPEFRGNNIGYLADIDEDGEDIVPTENEFNDEIKYVFERRQDNVEYPAYILLRGYYDNSSSLSYYKLDLIRRDVTTGVTSYLNLYRNFHYKVSINKVVNAGYESPQQAMNAAASNNIGASIEVSEVNTIRDGIDQLYVSTLDTLLVDPQDAYIYYTFTENIDTNSESVNNSRVRITPIGGLNTNVIASFNYDTPGVLRLTPAALPDLMTEQEFAVTVDGSDLSRRIRVRVRQPFQFRVVDCNDVVPKVVKSEIGLVIVLPENMPSSVFPLILDIEPERKTIYPVVPENGNGLPVHIGDDHTYSYVATITNTQYRTSRRFVYDFYTNIEASATTITVTNPYFLKENNTTRFINTGDSWYNFIDVTLESEGNGTFDETDALYTFNTFLTKDKKITLSFILHEEGDGYAAEGSHNIVEIYGDRINWDSAESETGNIVLDPDGDGIEYTPDDAYGVQSITFTINQDLATGNFQLTSEDHGTATVNYETPACKIRFQYSSNNRWRDVPQGSTINLYSDRNYRNLIDTYRVGNNGEITVTTLAEFDANSTLYFSYRSGRTTYRGSITIPDLEEAIGEDTPTVQLQNN